MKEAFHRVARPLVYGGEIGQGQLDGIIQALGLNRDVLPELHTYVQSESLFRTAGASTWLADMMKEFSRDTWFTMGQQQGAAIVTSGTRPGDNLADLVFSFLFSRILHALRDRFATDGVSFQLPWHPAWLCAGPEAERHTPADTQAAPLDVTWMDDLALLVAAKSPDTLMERVVSVATNTISECIRATLLPNLAKGKTEAVVCLRGKGAKRLASSVFRGADPSVQLCSTVWPEARLRLVPVYKHVGLIQAGGGHSKELRARIGAAWASFRLHQRKIFASPTVNAKDKAVLFMSVVESTLYYGVGAWPGIVDADVSRLQQTRGWPNSC